MSIPDRKHFTRAENARRDKPKAILHRTLQASRGAGHAVAENHKARLCRDLRHVIETYLRERSSVAGPGHVERTIRGDAADARSTTLSREPGTKP